MLPAALKRVRSPDFLLLIGVLLAILGAKFYLIQRFGSDLPFWDQWDAEGDRLYLSDARGTLSIGDFLAPHNEHRIVFTKLLAYGLEKLNGQWDARLEMTVNAVLEVGAIGLLLLVFRQQLRRFTWRIAAGISLVLFALPLAWENTLSGFQSQFYFLMLFSIAHLAGTFGTTPQRWTFWVGQVAGLCAIFSMGSGFFSAAAVLALLSLNVICERRISRVVGSLAVYNAILVLLGWCLHTDWPQHDSLKAHTLIQVVKGLAQVLAWPSTTIIVAGMTILPVSIIFLRGIRNGPRLLKNQFILGLIIWWAEQVIGLVFARGGNGTLLSPRYFDLLSIGTLLAASLWLELECKSFKPALLARTMSTVHIAWCALIGLGIWQQYEIANRNFLSPMALLNQNRIRAVRDYVQNQSSGFLEAKPFFELPYPDAERLAELLREPGLLAILPTSVRAGLTIDADPSSTHGFSEITKPASYDPVGYQLWGSSNQKGSDSAEFQSQWEPRPHFAFLQILVRGPVNSNDEHLWLETIDERLQIKLPSAAADQWVPINIKSPTESYRIVAQASGGPNFCFSQPVELPLFSWFSQKLLQEGTLLFSLGLAAVFVAIIETIRRRWSRQKAQPEPGVRFNPV